jgi:hypothetical protein
MNNSNQLLEEVKEQFSNFPKPTTIYSMEPYVKEPDNYRLMLQNKYASNISRELTLHDYSQILIENVLISDETILYLMPKLTELFLFQELDPFFFYSRLEIIDKSHLMVSQIDCINKLIEYAKDKESHLESGT